MNLLLDTQLVLWTAFWPHKLPRKASEAITRASRVYISSVFEIAMKASIGKLNIPFREFEVRLATSSGAERLPLTWEHACRSYDIVAAHADPFDRGEFVMVVD
jgi:PIN domain nuclease of toxin-antitoxin system